MVASKPGWKEKMFHNRYIGQTLTNWRYMPRIEYIVTIDYDYTDARRNLYMAPYEIEQAVKRKLKDLSSLTVHCSPLDTFTTKHMEFTEFLKQSIKDEITDERD